MASIAAWRRRVLVSIRAVGCVILLGLLLNPTRHQPAAAPPSQPVVTILVDRSASMNTPDESNATRFHRATSDARSIGGSFADHFDVQLIAFDRDIQPTTADELSTTQPAGTTSDLASALRASSASEPTRAQAIVLLSDGIHNVGPTSEAVDAARQALVLDTPIFTRLYGGGSTSSTDLSLELRTTQDLTLPAQSVPIAGRATYRGGAPATSVARLLRDDGTEADQSPLQFRAGGDEAGFAFSVTADQVGVHRYRVVLDPVPGDANAENDSTPYILRVVGEPIRALVLEGKPYWDTSFLLRTLASDPAIAVDAWVRVRPDRILRRTLSRGDELPATVPTSRAESSDIASDPAAAIGSVEDLRPYQIVVIGREADAFLTPSAVTALREWVANVGGSIVCFRGEPTSTSIEAFANLLPVRWTSGPAEIRDRLAMTDAGEATQWIGTGATDTSATSRLMPSLAANARGDTSGRPLATVLATAVDADGAARPAITFQPIGAGRVVVIDAAGLWRWSFLPPRFRDRQSTYGTLWQSMLRWLASGTGAMPGRSLSLRADKVLFDVDEPATGTLFGTADAPPSILLRRADQPDAAATRLTPTLSSTGVSSITFGRLAPGSYLAEIDAGTTKDAGTTIAFEVRRFGRELLDLEPRDDLLRRIAMLSGGDVLPADEPIETALRRRLDERPRQRTAASGEDVPAWDRPWILMLLVGTWSLEWWLRRHSGLM